MFRKGACVFSPVHGYGQVVTPGDSPLVRLLDGHELHLAADSLRPVPPDELDRTIARQTRFEHALAVRVWGRLAELGPLWLKGIDGLWTTPEALAQRERDTPGPTKYFLPDDLGDAVRVLEPGEFHADAVTCTVTRALQHIS